VNPNQNWSGPNRMRTSDTERERIAEILRAAMGEGRLTLEEGEETPQARLATRRGLRRHAAFVISIALILTGLWVLSGAQFFWPAIPLVFLVMGLVRHARWGNYHPRYSYAHRVAPWNAPQ
jgi:hypothetical protein